MTAPLVPRLPLPVDQRHRHGPFDVIGDVHGCLDELEDLLAALGYERNRDAGWHSPAGRTAVFVGDLVDRGPNGVGAVRLAMQMVDGESALAVPGNHDLQLERHLAGDEIPLLYGLAETAAEFARESDAFRQAVVHFFQHLPGHLLLDDGQLVVAHTGLGADLHGVDSPLSRRLAAYGAHSDDIDPHDVTRRHAWTGTYQAVTVVVYGHTPVSEAVWNGQTIDIDTGCVYGGHLTALRWPERTLLAVRARRVHAERRPATDAGSATGTSGGGTVSTRPIMFPTR